MAIRVLTTIVDPTNKTCEALSKVLWQLGWDSPADAVDALIAGGALPILSNKLQPTLMVNWSSLRSYTGIASQLVLSLEARHLHVLLTEAGFLEAISRRELHVGLVEAFLTKGTEEQLQRLLDEHPRFALQLMAQHLKRPTVVTMDLIRRVGFLKCITLCQRVDMSVEANQWLLPTHHNGKEYCRLQANSALLAPHRSHSDRLINVHFLQSVGVKLDPPEALPKVLIHRDSKIFRFGKRKEKAARSISEEEEEILRVVDHLNVISLLTACACIPRVRPKVWLPAELWKRFQHFLKDETWYLAV